MIDDNRRNLNLEKTPVDLEKQCDGTFYEVFFNEDNLVLKIQEYQGYKIKNIYQYSDKGNLSSKFQYQYGDRKSIIKTFYDYSTSKKLIKEKRFYKSKHEMVKKEIFTKGKLSKIYYYKKSLVYYSEDFDVNGSLIGFDYYHENGLKVK